MRNKMKEIYDEAYNAGQRFIADHPNVTEEQILREAGLFAGLFESEKWRPELKYEAILDGVYGRPRKYGEEEE